jgi:Tol biopolymer transport system component
MPLLIPFDSLTPTPGPTPTTTPRPIPAVLRNKIAFLSDRLGQTEVFVMDPDGGNVAWLTQRYPYDQARQQLALRGARRVVVQPDNRGVPQLYLVDPRYDLVQPITRLTGSAYHPAWMPGGDVIAFVSTEAGNDEVYTIRLDGSGLQRLTWNTWEWDKHPSWSPDGSQIVFYSNRYTGRTQIWIMNADGSGQRNLSDNAYNDWDPVWIP